MLSTACQKEEEKTLENEKVPCYSEREKKGMNPITIENSEVVKKLRLNGIVSYNPNAVINYVSFVDGTITQTYFSLGDKVEKGQVLADIQSPELNSMSSELSQLQKELKVAERELESVQDFYEDEVSSEKELIEAQSQKENIEAKLDELEQNMELFSARSSSGSYQIKAPQSGYVVENRIVPGMRFSADSDPLFTISDLDKVWVNLEVYAAHMTAIKEGMKVEIISASQPDEKFEAEIQKVSAVFDPEKNVMQAWAILENVDEFLKPGLHIEAIVETEKMEEEAPRLPAESVIFHNDKDYVVVVDDCYTMRREIDVLYRDETTVFVKEGLEIGEEIVTNNALLHFEHSTLSEE